MSGDKLAFTEDQCKVQKTIMTDAVKKVVQT